MKIELRNIPPHCVREGDIVYDVFEDMFGRVIDTDCSNLWAKIYLELETGDEYVLEVLHTALLSENFVIYRDRILPEF